MMTAGRQGNGQETEETGNQAFGRGPRTLRTDREGPAEPPEALLAHPDHPRPRVGAQRRGDHPADRKVAVDRGALVGPLPRAGRGRAAAERDPSAGTGADPRRNGEGGDRPGDVAAAPARPALDTAGAGEEAGADSIERARHPEAQRAQAAPGEDVQGPARPDVWAPGSATSWACMSARRTTPSCSRSTGRRGYRRLGGPRGHSR